MCLEQREWHQSVHKATLTRSQFHSRFEKSLYVGPLAVPWLTVIAKKQPGGCPAGSVGGACCSRSWDCEFKFHIGCGAYLGEKNLKKKSSLELYILFPVLPINIF